MFEGHFKNEKPSGFCRYFEKDYCIEGHFEAIFPTIGKEYILWIPKKEIAIKGTLGGS